MVSWQKRVDLNGKTTVLLETERGGFVEGEPYEVRVERGSDEAARASLLEQSETFLVANFTRTADGDAYLKGIRDYFEDSFEDEKGEVRVSKLGDHANGFTRR